MHNSSNCISRFGKREVRGTRPGDAFPEELGDRAIPRRWSGSWRERPRQKRDGAPSRSWRRPATLPIPTACGKHERRFIGLFARWTYVREAWYTLKR
jgi:hypothetical protein